MRNIHLYLLLILGLASCGGEVKQPEEVTPPPAPAVDTVSTLTPVKYHDESPHYDPAIADYLKQLQAKYSYIPMYFKDGRHFYFYVVNGDWQRYTTEDEEVDFKMGIVNENMDTILQPVYHKLYTPDATADGYVEIEVDKKKGLLNYRTKQVVTPTFDVIFPSTKKGIVAVGKRGNQHYNILADGSEQLLVNKSTWPNYLTMQDELNFDIKNAKWHYLIYTYAWYSVYEGDTLYAEGRGIIVPPSYMLATGFVAPMLESININNEGGEYILISSYNAIEKTIKTKWGFNVFISNFYEEGVEGRGYIAQEKNVAIIDNNNTVLGKASIYSLDHDFGQICKSSKVPYQFIGDTLIEVQTLYVEYGGIVSGTNYEGMTTYKYYKIEKNGKIVELETDRLFGYTGFTYITPAHFEGCFFVSRYRETGIKWPANEDLNWYVTHHLTSDDLDLMRNEIFASYGYKFKLPKWDQYFRSQEWYKPRYDNVDDKLNAYEKANLEVIKAAKEKLLKNPDKYINGHFESYFMAG